MHRRTLALVLTTAALFGLTACTGAPAASPSSASGTSSGTPEEAESGAPGEGQSVADACQLIQQTIVDATGEFESVASADPAAVVTAMTAAADKIAAVSSQVTNDEVAALLPSLQEMFEKTSEVMKALVDGDVSQLGEMSELGQSFQETSQKFQELCAS